MNRDALAYLQVSRAASSDRQTLSWTMHVLLRKFPSNAKFLLKTTLVIFATTPRPLSHAHRQIQAVRLQKNYAETLWNKHNVTSQVQPHTLAPGCCWENIHVQMYVLNHLKQRTKHHVQYGRAMAEFSLAATKEREVEPHDDITFVYWSVMTPLLVYWSE